MSEIEVPKNRNVNRLRRRAILATLIATSFFLLAIWFFRTQPPLSRGEKATDFVVDVSVWISDHEFFGSNTIGNSWNQKSSRSASYFRFETKNQLKTPLDVAFTRTLQKCDASNQSFDFHDTVSPDGKWLIHSIGFSNPKGHPRFITQNWLISTDGAKSYDLNISTQGANFIWKLDSSAFLLVLRKYDWTGTKAHPSEFILCRMDSPQKPETLEGKFDTATGYLRGFTDDGRLAATRYGSKTERHQRIDFISGETGKIDKQLPWMEQSALPKFTDEKENKNKKTIFTHVAFGSLSPDGKYLTTGYLKSNLNKISLPEPLASFFPSQCLHLWLVKTDGSGWIDLGETTARSYIDAGTLKWLPDSKHISVVKDDKLWVFPIR